MIIILVRLSITPGTPVDESADEDVSLLCAPQPPDEALLEVVNVIRITKTKMMTTTGQVKWYLDGILLRKLPDCSNGTDRCNMVGHHHH